ncbi:MAG: hypothetical protein DRH04_01705 [Deltaproteobacteria bacterium]|nr:MAG: hypothetical protein DRH04_01705 [Deltaproteobacteria bacterium]
MTDFLGFLSLFGQNSAVECSITHLEACNQQECEDLGAGYWWYDGSCRVDERQADYNGRIYQAPVRLGAAVDDGTIAAGDGLSIVVDIPAGERGYALLLFPNDLGYYFIDSTNVINDQLVPLAANGEKVVFDDLCAAVEEFPELKGEWVVAILMVPITVPEFNTLDDIAAYMNDVGLYSFGSYSIDVHCREETGSDCAPGNLSCTNKEDCEASGGVWHTYQNSDPTVVKCTVE